MNFGSLKIMLFMWQYGLVDTFTLFHYLYNTGTQYSGIVLSAMVQGNITKFPSTLFEPIAGLGVSYQFIKAAQTAAEQRARVATLAAFLSASIASVASSSPEANLAVGTAVAAHIAHMRNVLQIRGGQILSSKVNKIVLDSVKTPVLNIHTYRTQSQFTYNSKMIIDNIFQEHTAHRFLQGSARKIKPVALAPTFVVPIPIAPKIVKIISTALIGFTILGALYLFQPKR